MNPLCMIDMGGYLGKGASAMARAPSQTAYRFAGVRAPPNQKIAARPGSRGGEGTDQPKYNNMAGPAAQPRISMPDRRATSIHRAEQLRLFAVDGAGREPYTSSARAGNNVATSAAAGERRAGQ